MDHLKLVGKAVTYIISLCGFFGSLRQYYYYEINQGYKYIILNFKTKKNQEVRNFNYNIESVVPFEINLKIIEGSTILDNFMNLFGNKNYVEMKELLTWLKNALNAYVDPNYLETNNKVNQFTKEEGRVVKNIDAIYSVTKYYVKRTLDITIKQKSKQNEKIDKIEALIDKLDYIRNYLQINSVFTLENKKSGKYVDVFGSLHTHDTPIIEFNKTSNPNQQFKFLDGIIIAVCNNKPVGWTKINNVDFLQIKEISLGKMNQKFKINTVIQTTDNNKIKKWCNIEVAGDSNWVWDTDGTNIIIRKKNNKDSQLFCVNFI